MIHMKDGLPVDQTGDGGDSAMRVGMLALFRAISSKSLLRYEVPTKSGLLMRHPVQKPWDNPWNFTRDQLVPFMAGCWSMNTPETKKLARRVLWSHIGRFLFCQNFERDYPGSTKYPWKHTFINDKGQVETRKFDFADHLWGPTHFLHLILASRAWYLYWLNWIGYRRLPIVIAIHAKSAHKEHNQIIAQVKVAGPIFVRLFKKLVVTWEADLREYWGSRNQIEYAEMIIEDLRGI